MADRMPMIAGNWKMHHTHLDAIQVVQKFVYRLDEGDCERTQVVVCPAFTALRSIQTMIDADNLAGQIVTAAGLERLADQHFRRCRKINRMSGNRRVISAVGKKIMHAVGRENKDIPGFDGQRLIINFQINVDADGAAEIFLVARSGDPVVGGQWFQLGVPQSANTGVANVKNMRGR